MTNEGLTSLSTELLHHIFDYCDTKTIFHSIRPHSWSKTPWNVDWSFLTIPASLSRLPALLRKNSYNTYHSTLCNLVHIVNFTPRPSFSSQTKIVLCHTYWKVGMFSLPEAQGNHSRFYLFDSPRKQIFSWSRQDTIFTQPPAWRTDTFGM